MSNSRGYSCAPSTLWPPVGKHFTHIRFLFCICLCCALFILVFSLFFSVASCFLCFCSRIVCWGKKIRGTRECSWGGEQVILCDALHFKGWEESQLHVQNISFLCSVAEFNPSLLVLDGFTYTACRQSSPESFTTLGELASERKPLHILCEAMCTNRSMQEKAGDIEQAVCWGTEWRFKVVSKRKQDGQTSVFVLNLLIGKCTICGGDVVLCFVGFHANQHEKICKAVDV